MTKRRTLGEDHNQCPSCGLYFNSDAAFDKHRTGKHGVDRRCMTIPEMEKIVMIDGQEVQSVTTTYVLPGKHTYTFKVKYRSSTYCNGPFYGEPADPKKDFKLKDGEVSSVVGMDGNYEIDASANEGQTVQFTVKAKPDCKSKINEYFKIEVLN